MLPESLVSRKPSRAASCSAAAVTRSLQIDTAEMHRGVSAPQKDYWDEHRDLSGSTGAAQGGCAARNACRISDESTYISRIPMTNCIADSQMPASSHCLTVSSRCWPKDLYAHKSRLRLSFLLIDQARVGSCGQRARLCLEVDIPNPHFEPGPNRDFRASSAPAGRSRQNMMLGNVDNFEWHAQRGCNASPPGN